MKKLNLLFIVLCFSLSISAQTYSSPESLEFDYANNRWLISNKGANNILARSSTTGDLSIFATGVTSPHGIEIANDTVYVCSGSSLVAYELNTGASVFSINLGATYLNGITHDSTYLYITDFSAKVIYRFNMVTRAYSIYISALSKSPNGIIFDQANNRCVFVNWGSNAPIMAFDVSTANVSQLTPTTLGNCDGIAIDGLGNFYVSSWTLNGISKFDNSFSSPPANVVTGLTSPADIFYNILDDTLGVANSGSLSNTTYHYFGTSTSVQEIGFENSSFNIYPNPMRHEASISYELQETDHVTISVFDMRGELVRTISDAYQEKTVHQIIFQNEEMTPGVYFVRIAGNKISGTRLFVIAD